MNKCEGQCANSGECLGEVRKVLVVGLAFIKPLSFFYCLRAISVDKIIGFRVYDASDVDLENEL